MFDISLTTALFFYRGVNMYAMLTGKLPYTAEPFHITTLYNKMKRNEMNPIPDHLSSCRLIFITSLPKSIIIQLSYFCSSLLPDYYYCTNRHFEYVARGIWREDSYPPFSDGRRWQFGNRIWQNRGSVLSRFKCFAFPPVKYEYINSKKRQTVEATENIPALWGCRMVFLSFPCLS